MFIEIKTTPNPETLQFLLKEKIRKDDLSLSINKGDDTARFSPLAVYLFNIEGVESIFLSNNFISVTKNKNYTWEVLKTMIASSIIDHYNNGLSIVSDSFYNDVNDIQKNTSGPNDSIIVQIKDVIDTKVRPAVAEDGGDIIFDSFKDGIVYLRMQGACSGCPSSTITLKAGVENLLKRYVPEVQSVESI